MALPGTGEIPMVSPSASAGPAGAVAGAARSGGRTVAACLAGGRFCFVTRAGRCFGTGTLMVGSAVEGLAAGARGAPGVCAHTLHGTSNAATPTHTRRMHFPAEFMAEAEKTRPNASVSVPAATPRIAA